MADPLGALSDWILYALGVVGLGGGGGVIGYVRRVDAKAEAAHDLARRNNDRLEGTDDPNDDGVLKIAKRNGEKIDSLSDRMDQQHGELMAKVDERFEELERRVK